MVTTDVVKAYIFGNIIDTINSGGNIRPLIWWSCVFALSIFIIYYLGDLLYEKLCKNIIISLRHKIMRGVLHTDLSKFDKNLGSKYINNLTNDINIIYTDYLSNMKVISISVISFILSLYMIFRVSDYFGIFLLVISVIPVFISKLFIKTIQEGKKTYSDSFQNLISKTKNILDGFSVISTFNIQKEIEHIYGKTNKNIEKSRYSIRKKECFIEDFNGAIAIGIFLGTILFGAYLVSKGKISIGNMLMVIQLSNNILNPVQKIPGLVGRLKSIDLIYDDIEKVVTLTDDSYFDGYIKNSFDREIKISNLSYSYNGTDNILDNVEIEIEKNKKYAIVGESGCGKSTFIKIIQGLYNDYDGSINLDGIDLKNLEKESLSSLIITIEQDTFLFNDTIKNNIGLYKEYSDEDIDLVIEKSGLKSTIDKLEDGIQTIITENGSNLSGGQKQRIAIARALIKDTPILILDESTSALDINTKLEIEDTIMNLDNKTIIFITHQLEHIDKFDKIICFGNDLVNLEKDINGAVDIVYTNTVTAK
jgi:ABC-type multidrug transport system fused ATPase/permease subunit